jgi:hypothetical protein
MHERHPVETSPRYHVVIWVIVGLVVAGLVFGIVKRANEPPAELAPRPGAANPDHPAPDDAKNGK